MSCAAHLWCIVSVVSANNSFAVPTAAFAQAMAGADRVVHRATPAEAFARAREIFRAGQRLDMVSLAADLGVGRATLYRWTGDRERLLADVAFAEADLLFGYLERHTPGRASSVSNASPPLSSTR